VGVSVIIMRGEWRSRRGMIKIAKKGMGTEVKMDGKKAGQKG
jgi:hypothetical protein